MAMTEDIFVERDNAIFVVAQASDKKKKYLEPDDELCRAITGDELKKKMREAIHNFFANR